MVAVAGRTVTADQLPSLHGVLPALIDTDCHPDVGHEIDIFIAGVQTTARRLPHRNDAPATA